MSKIIYPTNEYQTEITEELINSLPKEVSDQLLELLNSVEFIRRLVSPDRKRAKDLERDKEGKIIVDVVNPHILEDMDYFRPVAIHFAKHGKITNLRPNSNPNSPFYKWLKEEINRIWNGMVRPSDGEWITGEMYFYLNYMPMRLTQRVKGKKRASNRIVGTPRSWEGIYLWFHYLQQARYGGIYDGFTGGKHAIQVATRGASKSYSCASMLARQFLCGDNSYTKKEVVGVILAALKDTLVKDGTLNKFEACLNFCAEYTEFPSQRLFSSLNQMNWEMGYIDPVDNQTKRGTRNTVMGVSTNNDPEKARGKRATKIIYEEIGAFPKFLDTWTVNEPSVQEGDEVWGQMIGIGTGGTEGSNFYGVMEMLYNPVGYNIYPLPNFYDKNTKGRGNTIFFFGAYLNREGYYNHDGVSDVVGTIVNILMNRYRVKYNSSDPSRLTRVIAERPLTIQEAIMRRDTSLFPAAQLTEVLNRIDNNPTEYNDVFTGVMSVRNGKPEFSPSNDLPIRDFPHNDSRVDGVVEIFKMPEYNRDNKVYPNRYIAGTDPVDDDSNNQGLSLQSTFVLDTWTDKIVAEYTGRPVFTDDYYEQLRLLLLYYNAEDNYENNKKGLFSYFNRKNSLFLLSDTLEFLRDKDLIKGQKIGNQSKGFNATSGINIYARRLIRDWLLEDESTIITNEEGEQEEVIRPRLYSLRSRALIQELIQWDEHGNYDRVSALGATMLLRQSRLNLYKDNYGKKANDIAENEHYLGNDEFFKNNYNLKFGIKQ